VGGNTGSRAAFGDVPLTADSKAKVEATVADNY
jgi:hypothetical protein